MCQMGYNLAKQIMENNNETQSRRQFFKEAAKKALPIIGAVALLSNPVIARTVENEPMGCSSGSCYGTCSGSCQNSCLGDCEKSCLVGCKTSCQGTCKNTCIGSCDGTCRRSNY